MSRIRKLIAIDISNSFIKTPATISKAAENQTKVTSDPQVSLEVNVEHILRGGVDTNFSKFSTYRGVLTKLKNFRGVSEVFHQI